MIVRQPQQQELTHGFALGCGQRVKAPLIRIHQMKQHVGSLQGIFEIGNQIMASRVERQGSRGGGRRPELHLTHLWNWSLFFILEPPRSLGGPVFPGTASRHRRMLDHGRIAKKAMTQTKLDPHFQGPRARHHREPASSPFVSSQSNGRRSQEDASTDSSSLIGSRGHLRGARLRGPVAAGGPRFFDGSGRK